MNMNKQSKKIALIVGASSTLGRAAGLILAKSGYMVGVNDWAPEACEKVVREITTQSGDAAAYPADPSKKLAFQTMLEHFLEEHEKIDLLVTSSAIEPKDTLLEMDEWDWRRAIDLNLGSVFVSMQSVGRVMRDLGAGSILNLVRAPKESSSLAYRTAIASIQALSDEASIELQPFNIQVAQHTFDGDSEGMENELATFLK
jgi:NAD(P)-dependent dehydrogenase (short-subunit alcohol dehydrogenase family)